MQVVTSSSSDTLDLKEGPAFLAGEPNRRALVDLGGARTSLLLPLLKEDTVLGTIMIYRQEMRAFSGSRVPRISCDG